MYAVRYPETLIILEVAFSVSIALLNTAQFNQFLCVSKALPSSILALSGGEFSLLVKTKPQFFFGLHHKVPFSRPTHPYLSRLIVTVFLLLL